MENILREGSAKTPAVNFDSASGVLELKGRSIPENSVEFYKPLNDWIENYGANPKDKTIVDINLIIHLLLFSHLLIFLYFHYHNLIY